MLRVGKMTDYALLLTNQLVKSGDELNTTEQLAKATHVPLATVRKLLKLLVDAGIVTSYRGANGGYCLANDPAKLTIADVISAIEGPIALTECSTQQSVCDLASTCGLKTNWSYLNQIVTNMFEQITLADMSCSIDKRIVEFSAAASSTIS
jgi:FeS assembly SUF system regulator